MIPWTDWGIHRVSAHSVEGNADPTCGVRGHIQQRAQSYMPFLSPATKEIPIYLAGVNRRMIQLAGSHADGLTPSTLNSVPYLKDTLHLHLKKGLDKRGTGHCELCVTRICAVHEDLRRARDLARHAIAFYSILPYYDM